MKKVKEFITSKEYGYSLLEVSVAVGIMVIGLAIALPNFNSALETQAANDLKNKMLSAGMIMESARFQNNGEYPSEVPEELLNNPDYADFVYSVDEENQDFCIMGRDDSNQKYFADSGTNDPYAPTEELPGCTEENIIWVPQNPNEPPAPTLVLGSPVMATGSNTWTRANYSSALANFSWTSGTCGFSGPLPSYMGGVQSIDYQARAIEPASGNVYMAFNGSYVAGNSVANLALSGWLPDSNIQYQVRMRCLADFEYNYTNWVSYSDTIASFPVEDSGTSNEEPPTVDWPSTSEWPILNFRAAAIQCPTAEFSPVYKANITQVGATAIDTGWQNSIYFTVTLVGFSGNKDVSWSVTSGCEINDTIFESNEPYTGGEQLLPPADEQLPIPIPPPSPVTGINCVTKYERLTESTSGGCIQDETLEAEPTTPEAIRWNQTECTVGTDYYQVRYSVNGQSPTEWENLGANQEQYLFTQAMLAGVSVNAEVRAYCVIGSESSDFSTSTSKSFTTDYPPPSTEPIQVSWTPSTDGVGENGAWVDTAALQGDSYMYDRMIGTAQATCANNILPSGWRVYITATFPDGTTRSLPTSRTINSSTLQLDRSDWLSSQDQYWMRGASVAFEVEAKCPSLGGVYADLYTDADSLDTPIKIGYPILPTETVTVSCVSKYQRLTEATKGNCSYDANVAEQATVPNALKWSAPAGICVTGYSPTYKVFNAQGSLVTTTTSSEVALVGLTADTNYTYTMQFNCIGDGGRTSTDSPVNTKSFTSSLPPSTVALATPTVNFTPSTADSFWTATDGGSSPLNDRLTATTSFTCPAGYSVSGINVSIQSGDVVTAQSFSGSSPYTINRSTSTQLGTFWQEGSTFTPRASVNCANPDYATALTTPIANGNSISVGWTAPATSITGFNCHILQARSPESSYGGCTTTSGLTTTSRAPQELRWSAVSGTVCSTKTGVPRYWISASASGPWTNNGTSTSFVVGNSITAGQSYTYYVQYDCFNSSTGSYSSRSGSTSKSFTASFLRGSVSTPTVSWSTSTADSSFSATSSGSYSMIDRVTGTLSGTSCPSGYSVASAPWNVRLSGSTASLSTNNSSTMVINRSSNSTSLWPEGENLASIITYSISCTGGDYGTLTSSFFSPNTTMQIGVLPPSGSYSISISNTTGNVTSETASYSYSGSKSCGSGASLNNSFYVETAATGGLPAYAYTIPTTRTVYYGGTTYAEISSYCSRVNSSGVTITSGSTFNSNFKNINRRTNNVVTVSARAVGTNGTISGSYSQACPTGTSRTAGVWAPTGYYAYNGQGLTGVSFWSNPGNFSGTGFVGVAGDNDGGWSRSGYGTYEAQGYGFRIDGQNCANNQTGITMGFNGWVSFWLKSSTYTNTNDNGGYSYPTW